MSWQTNFKDTAHYVPLTGEIRTPKIQGEGRGYPDSVSGDRLCRKPNWNCKTRRNANGR